MARRELGPTALRVAQAVADALPDGGDVVVGLSGGADSLALALGTVWAAPRRGVTARAVVVDHRLQPGSGDVAAGTADQMTGLGLPTDVVAVDVHPSAAGLEAAAREARLAALAASGAPVLLGHTLDDQAETVLLGLLRGSGARSLAGMAAVRGQFRRPLLGLRRTETVAACREWGVEPWADPMNDDDRFARVRARRVLATLSGALGRDLAPALARTAALSRADADLLDDLARGHVPDADELEVAAVAGLPDALRWRVLHAWLSRHGEMGMAHVLAVADLVDGWRGQGPIAVPGGAVERADGVLRFR